MRDAAIEREPRDGRKKKSARGDPAEIPSAATEVYSRRVHPTVSGRCGVGVTNLEEPTLPQAGAAPRMATCTNCKRYCPMTFNYSFSSELEQTKNQAFHTSNQSWIVTPSSSRSAPSILNQSSFCSGDCLFSFLFSHELLSSRSPDVALHFFKRTDEQRQWLPSQTVAPQEINTATAPRLAEAVPPTHRPS